MDTPDRSAPPRGRRVWVAPQLVRHQSLTALTLQHVDPISGRPLDPNDPDDIAVIMQGISGGPCVFNPC
jgi:hypothetical protein